MKLQYTYLFSFVLVLAPLLFLLAPSAIAAPRPAAALSQTDFWFRDDDGTQLSATGYGSSDIGKNTSIVNVASGTVFRLRFGIKDTNADAALVPRLEFKQGTNCAVGSWAAITPTSNIFSLYVSDNFNDGDPTTQQITNGSFVAGKILELTNPASSLILQNGKNTEYEWSIKVAGATSPGTTYSFRVSNNGAVFNGYGVCPALATPGAVKFIFTNVPSSATAGDTATFNVYAVDSFNTIDTSFNQDVTVTKTGAESGAPTGGGLVTIINGIGTSTVSDTLAETVSLALQDTQSTGLNVSSTASIVFSGGPITRFFLDHPGNMNTGARLGYTLSRQDQFHNPASGSSTIAYLYSSSMSAGKAFFDAALGGNQITSTTVPVGSTSTKFWYYDTVPGTLTITASDNPASPDGAAGIADAVDTMVVAPGAVKFIFANTPSSVTAGDTATFNVYAVDSFNTIDTSFNQDVTVTKTGSASGGGLVDIVNGIATTTITDSAAEDVSLGLQDTQSTGLGVADAKTIAFIAAPASLILGPAAPLGIPLVGVKPWVNIMFSGFAYPEGSISLIRKDMGLSQAPVLQTANAAPDGNFSVELNNIIRLTGQTYMLVFADKNGVVSETKAYNIPAGKEDFVDENLVIAPTVGFSGDSVVSRGGPVVLQGYAAPRGTVALLVDGSAVGTVTVNDPSGRYRYLLDTANVPAGRHSVAATQVYDGIQSDSSSQQSFTVSPLANPKLDLNGDGAVDIKDVSIYLSYLKNLVADGTGYHTADPNLIRVLDLNGDGKIDVQDVSILFHAGGLR